MSATTELLRTVDCFNDYQFFDGDAPPGQVWIDYMPNEARSPIGARWTIHRRGHQTDPSGPWYTYGNKTFSAYGRGGRAEALAVAQAWAGSRYGIAEWKRTPFGGYGDAAFVKARLAELKAQATARPGYVLMSRGRRVLPLGDNDET